MSIEVISPESTYDVSAYETIHEQLMDAAYETGHSLSAKNGEVITGTIGDNPAQFFLLETPEQTISELSFLDPNSPAWSGKTSTDKSTLLQPPNRRLSLQFDHPKSGVAKKRLSYVSFEGAGIVNAIVFNPTSELQYDTTECVDALASQLNDIFLSLKLIERA